MKKITLYEAPENYADTDDAREKEVKKITLESHQFFRAGGGVLWFADKKAALNHMANLPSAKQYFSK
tara:strand:- start:166 stop:366 length:201 start_codon:yes stop_codon:yes gene_type:complete